MDKSREKLPKEHDEATVRAEQNQVLWLENRIRDQQEAERKRRRHHLITCGAEVESVAPEVCGMSQAAFRLLVGQIFSLPEVASLVNHAADQQKGG